MKLNIFLLPLLALEFLFAPIAKAEQNSVGDIVIIGNTSDKQLEMENYWTGYGKKRTISNSQTNENIAPDENTARFCRREQRNPFSAYDKHSECVTTELKAKDLLLNTGIKDKANPSDLTSCSHRSTGYNQTEPTAWSYRYSCIKNAVERQTRNQHYMDNH